MLAVLVLRERKKLKFKGIREEVKIIAEDEV